MTGKPSSFPFRTLLKVLAWSVGLGGLAALGALWLTVRHFSQGLPDARGLEQGYEPPQLTRILARDDSLLANIFSERRTVVPVGRMPDHLKNAFLAAEDAGFYEHQGLDYLGLLRAMVANVRAGRVKQGGSTITQQVVKNVLLDHERSYRRKIRETILAYDIEKSLTKDQILGIYMNQLYLGHGRYGVEEAGLYYFGKHVNELNAGESALIAGIVAAPEKYSPRRSEKLARERRAYVLGQMLNKGFMTREAYDAFLTAPLRLTPRPEEESDLAPEAVERARRFLSQAAPERARRGGFTLKTTIHPALQVSARKAVRDGLDAYLKRHKLAPPFTLSERRLWGKAFQGTPRQHGIYAGTVAERDDAARTIDVKVGDVVGRLHLAREERYNPTHLVPTHFVDLGALLRVRVLDDPTTGSAAEPIRLALELGPQAALVALDVATGEALALVGSYEGLAFGLDRTTSHRQPGSAFKPIYYSRALGAQLVTAATHFAFPRAEAKPREVAPEGGDDPALDILSLRQGIAQSDNRVALRVFQQLGGAEAVRSARALGITSRLEGDDSLALGAYEITPLELGAAYLTFANGGRAEAARFLLSASSAEGPLPLPLAPEPTQVMTPEVAYLTTSLLESVVQEGTAARAAQLGFPLAGKTGTTNQAKDAWFAGYSVDYVVAVWVGYDDALPLGSGESGGATALPIWMAFMKAAQAGKVAVDFPRPPGLLEAEIDPHTGLLARYEQEDALREIFLPATVPTEVAPEVTGQTQTQMPPEERLGQ